MVLSYECCLHKDLFNVFSLMTVLDTFNQFFDHCIGNWDSERTYHYLSKSAVERSHTAFGVAPLTREQKTKVLTDNSYTGARDLADCPGFHLVFHTVSEKGEVVDQALNLAFVPRPVENSDQHILEGDYLRDRAYEEDRPIVSHFRFDSCSRELLMTTPYTHIISVDSITLVNPHTRVRRILNYLKPPEGAPMDQPLLVGFGVEQKREA